MVKVMDFFIDFIKSFGLFLNSETEKFVKESFKRIKDIYSDVYIVVNSIRTDSVKNTQDKLECCIKKNFSDVISIKEMLILNYEKKEKIIGHSRFWDEAIVFLGTVEYLLKPQKDVMVTNIYKNSIQNIFEAQQEIIEYSKDKTLLQLYSEYSKYYSDKLTYHYKKVCKEYHLLEMKIRKYIKILAVIIICVFLLYILWKWKCK